MFTVARRTIERLLCRDPSSLGLSMTSPSIRATIPRFPNGVRTASFQTSRRWRTRQGRLHLRKRQTLWHRSLSVR
jgi:hypothetical protein